VTYFGPVAVAARDVHLLVGFVVLILTWVGYSRKDSDRVQSVWIKMGISAICVVFIVSGVVELLR
jgi:hypothetical protein